MEMIKYLCCAWVWFKRHWFHLLAYGVAIGYAIFTIGHFEMVSENGNQGGFTLASLFGPLLALFAIAFVHLFTTPIPFRQDQNCTREELEQDDEVKKWQRRNWMIFAYSFMLLSMVIAIVPFTESNGTASSHKTDEASSAEQSRTRDEHDYQAPISFLIACSNSAQDLELSCKKTQTDRQDKPPIANATQPASTSDLNDNTDEDSINDTGAAWAINIGGYVQACKSGLNGIPICQTKGGLLIPLYFVILALMGGSISLTRRLPEYQKQASPGYCSTEKAPKISQHEFREYLAFQMIQFLSAPLVAILAYYLVSPGSTVASVAIAFTAGFSSETILLMVRAVTEKITPQVEFKKLGTVTGLVTMEDGAAKLCVVANAQVFLVSQPSLSVQTDARGYYALANVPMGEHAIKAVSTEAGNVSCEGNAIVCVERNQPMAKLHISMGKKS